MYSTFKNTIPQMYNSIYSGFILEGSKAIAKLVSHQDLAYKGQIPSAILRGANKNCINSINT